MATSSPGLMSYCKKPVDQTAIIINTAWANTDAVFYWEKLFATETQRTQRLIKLIVLNLLQNQVPLNNMLYPTLNNSVFSVSLWQKLWSSNANSTGY